MRGWPGKQLTLRLLGRELKIQAATVYWHFKSKEELLDEMATIVLAEEPVTSCRWKEAGDWRVWAASFGTEAPQDLIGHTATAPEQLQEPG